ncbi:MAG: signal peptidase I [Planctomycetota bacterium]|nr:signal peptidase I [Planctomycetota bacterium]
MDRQKLKSRLVRLWNGWIKPFLIILILAGAVRSAIADWNDVPTGSMKPSIIEGDRIFVNKLAYDLKVPFTLWRLARWAEPARGDVVVFFEPVHEQRYVKRVIGRPGDEIELRGNRLIVNGRAVESRSDFGPVTVPEGQYFLMGDNRDQSLDSRYFGFVERDRIVGRASRIIFSVDSGRWYAPRPERFFEKLQ